MAPLPDKVTIDTPSDPVVLMDIVEDYSEEVANRFVAFAYELKRRDFDAAREWIAPEFAGQSLFADYESETADMPLDASRETFAFEKAPVQGKTAWLDSIKDGIGAWEHVDAVVFKVKGAEFQRGRPLWGKVRFKLSFLGSAIGGGPEAVTVWTWARVEKRRGKWTMTGLELTSRKTERRDAPLFTEVSSSTGLGHAGVRFGKQGNTLFAWQGVAGGDVNGDGLWDLFLTSQSRNFLYLAQPDGGFEESADAWGVRKPAGGTSSLFLDFDNDGDQDLFVADEGWQGPNGQTQGNPLRLFVNKGDKYEEQGASLG
ncbi:MAG TPA: VCBS repeat-containing protein, partial [Planctomycetes bacterium]|nr:VCBS repeat-containing protein [Planctomycetota bacterium]